MGAGQNISILADDYAAARSTGDLRTEPKVIYCHFFCGDGHYCRADGFCHFYCRSYTVLCIGRGNFLDDNFFFCLRICQIGAEIAAGQRDHSSQQQCPKCFVGFFPGRRNGIFIMYIEIIHYFHPFLIEFSANRQQAGDIQPKNQLIPVIT